MNKEQKELFEKWQNFDNLSSKEQKELIAEKKEFIDKREAERKAAKEEFEQKWANFDNLSIQEQKMLLDRKEHCFNPRPLDLEFRPPYPKKEKRPSQKTLLPENKE